MQCRVQHLPSSFFPSFVLYNWNVECFVLSTAAATASATSYPGVLSSDNTTKGVEMMTTLPLAITLLLLRSPLLLSHQILLPLRQKLSSVILASSILLGSTELNAASAKLINLEPAAMAKIVAGDITDRQALITADFTRDIYSEKCTFQDEIDTYPIDKYVSGTKALFNKDKSHVDLVGDVVATSESVDFKFSEVLAFNIPFNPSVFLTGRVKLSRGDDGLVTSSREFWDQSVPAVLSTVKFR